MGILTIELSLYGSMLESNLVMRLWDLKGRRDIEAIIVKQQLLAGRWANVKVLVDLDKFLLIDHPNSRQLR